jgi:glycosyltransferase involved in cell wall biosynthesis
MSKNKHSNQHIWIDMTDMASWRGFFTGTQRVAYEVAKRLHKHQPNTSCFVYNERTQSFYEISFDAIEAQVNPAPQTGAPVAKPRFHRPSVKNVVRAQSLRVYHNLPYSVKQKLTPERKDTLKAVYRKLQSASRIVRPAASPVSRLVAPDSPALQFGANDTVVILGKPWDTMSLIDVLRRQKIDSGFKLVNLVYDMIPVYSPHLFGKPLPTDYTSYMFEALSLSDQVVAISESTKNDVARFCQELHLPTPPITVTKLGDYSSADSSHEGITDVAGLSKKDFILCIGTIENRKNHALLYTAYREADLRGIDLPDLAIVGGTGVYTTDILYQITNDPIVNKKIHVLRGIDDANKDWLFRNCKFTVYPSVYEGWGLPIAESLAYGKVCVSSFTSSMREIAGDLIEYFSPYDSVGCMKLIQKYTDPKVCEAKEKEIKKHYKAVTWDEPYERVLAAIKATK